MTASTLIEAARTVGVPFACVVLMWYDHRDEKRARREEREKFAEVIEEQTAAFRSLQTEVRIALADGGRERPDDTDDS